MIQSFWLKNNSPSLSDNILVWHYNCVTPPQLMEMQRIIRHAFINVYLSVLERELVWLQALGRH